ncbi:MAG: DUF1501 domain-containing protein [Planctomycetes bacterium]|nr:DUF1501 domain-containing protein [Planctomycetota bacterium]
MLRILGRGTKPCDGVSRREALCVGGLSLFGGLTLPRLLAAEQAQGGLSAGPAKSVILVNLFGGPPHMDMFDMKPAAPEQVRGEFKPIATSVPGLSICELLPLTAQVMDRTTLIRTYSHQYNSHNPYNVYTGFDGGNDRENYFAKRSDHPGMGAVCQYLNLGRTDIPRYVIMPAYPGYSQSLRRAGPYGGYLGSQYDPLFTIWDKKFESKGEFYKPTVPLGVPLLPALGNLTDVTVDRLDRRKTLLEQIDQSVAAIEASPAAQGMNHFQQQVFSLLTSAKTRAAFDVSGEPDSIHQRYGKNLWGSSAIIARRLVEAGSTFVSINWEEADSGNHWDMHNNNFGMCRVLLPLLDQLVSGLILDLEERGLLDSTLVVVMGEMGRTPRVNGAAGRDHWPQCGFVLLAGGGVKQGFVLGKTDEQAAYPVDRPVSAGDMVATIYQLLGIDPTLTVADLTGRPIHISHGGAPALEIMA